MHQLVYDSSLQRTSTSSPQNRLEEEEEEERPCWAGLSELPSYKGEGKKSLDNLCKSFQWRGSGEIRKCSHHSMFIPSVQTNILC